MNFACDHCQRRYSIPDEKIRGKVVRVRCRNCQNPILLRGAGSDPPTPSGVRPAPVVQPPGDWYVMVKGQQVGPLPDAAFRARVDAGEITPRSFVWRKGMTEWQRAETLDVLRPVFGLEPADLVSQKPAAAPAPTLTRADTPSAVHRRSAEQRQATVARRGPKLQPAATPTPTSAPALAGELSQLPTGPELIQNPNPARRTVSQDFLFQELDALQPSERRADLVGDIPIGAAPTDPSDVSLASIGAIRPSAGDFEVSGTHFPDMLENERKGPFRTFVKVLLTAVTLVALLTVGLILLGLVPLDITRVDAEGKEVRESVFARGIIPGLEDLFAGKTLEFPVPFQIGVNAAPSAGASPGASAAKAPPGTPPMPPSPAAAAKGGSAPTERTSKTPPQTGAGVESGEGEERTDASPSDSEAGSRGGHAEGRESEIARVPSAAALTSCVSAERQRNPDIELANQVARVRANPDGTVAAVRLADAEVDASELGECLKTVVRPMTFGKSEEGERDYEVPLTLGSSQ